MNFRKFWVVSFEMVEKPRMGEGVELASLKI